jgi:putative DNA primase/helicase
MNLVYEGQLQNHYGLLALIYNCYTDLTLQVQKEERITERYFSLRWGSYMRAYSKWTAPEQSVHGVEKHLEREAIRVLSSNVNERGVAFSDFFNASMMIEDWEKISATAAPGRSG